MLIWEIIAVWKQFEMGSIVVDVVVKTKTKRTCIKNALNVPKLQDNLLAMRKLLSIGLRCSSTEINVLWEV
jgi:hypothetical protein